MKKVFFITIPIIISIFSINFGNVYADELTDSIKEQMQNIDLSALENLLSEQSFNGFSFNELLHSILKGEYVFSFDNFFSYLLNVLLSNVYQFLPSLMIIVSMAILSSIITSAKSNFLPDGVSSIVSYVFILTMLLIVGSQLIQIYNKTKNTIILLSNLCEIMSPIILTLMVASGGSVSASIYKPAVAFLSGGIINLILSVILPLILLSSVFSILSTSSDTIKLNKLTDSINSLIKWILGLISAVFGLFLTIQGITSALHDGISLRATKYTISNSIPLVGSLVKDGFDLIVAGSVLIKNSIGLASIIGIFYLILSPVTQMIVFSFLLKFIAGITEPIADKKISDLCIIGSKTLSYLITCILIVGLMIFICVLLMIFSANAFI